MTNAGGALTAAQSVLTVGLYGGTSGASQGMGDLYAIANGVSTGIAKDAKLFFKSAVLEVQIQNDHATTPACVDIYEWVYRKSATQNPDDIWQQALSNQTALYSGTLATYAGVGVTPFDAPGFGTFVIIKKTTRARIAPGNSFYLQMRVPKDYFFDTSKMYYDGSGNDFQYYKGMTQGYMIVGRSSEIESGTPDVVGNLDLQVMTARSYHWTQTANATDEQGVATD
jgi:hypothetical protein